MSPTARVNAPCLTAAIEVTNSGKEVEIAVNSSPTTNLEIPVCSAIATPDLATSYYIASYSNSQGIKSKTHP
ncbi:MAG: hypothetical protein AAFQ14_15320 [Cyanobacteria bacterium J06621_12]